MLSPSLDLGRLVYIWIEGINIYRDTSVVVGLIFPPMNMKLEALGVFQWKAPYHFNRIFEYYLVMPLVSVKKAPNRHPTFNCTALVHVHVLTVCMEMSYACVGITVTT